MSKITGNPGQLNQVFLNIFNNGIDVIEELVASGKKIDNPRIKISTEESDRHSVKIRI